MSQIQAFLGSEGPGPGPLLSLTTDTAAVITPTNPAGTINVLGNAFAGSTGFAFTSEGADIHTLAIIPLNAGVTSNDATFTTLYTLAIPNGTAAFILARIIGVKNDHTVCVGGNLFAIARNNGAGVTVPVTGGSLLTDKAAPPNPGGQIINNAGNLLLQVRGAALGDVYNWIAHIEYQTVS